VKDDEKNKEEEWRQEWINRICPDGKPSLLSPLDQISVFKGFLDDIVGRNDGLQEQRGGGRQSSKKNEIS
jgi:hypothetical protein